MLRSGFTALAIFTTVFFATATAEVPTKLPDIKTTITVTPTSVQTGDTLLVTIRVQNREKSVLTIKFGCLEQYAYRIEGDNGFLIEEPQTESCMLSSICLPPGFYVEQTLKRPINAAHFKDKKRKPLFPKGQYTISAGLNLEIEKHRWAKTVFTVE